MPRVVISGSVAFDYLMRFPGDFHDFLPRQHDEPFALSFLVDGMVRRRGGTAPNIAYTLALLGERPQILAAVGEDFGDYRAWLEEHGVDTTAVRVIPGEHTAAFFGVTDLRQSQLGIFHPGAMSHARELSLFDLPQRPDIVVVSPEDPETMRKRVREAKAMGVAFCYDPGQQVVRLSGDDLREGIAGARAVCFNEFEFGIVQQKTGWDLAAVRAQADLVVVTKGELGSTVYTDGQVHHIPIAPLRHMADPTGAGDAYRGGFLKGLLLGFDPGVAGRMGAVAAAFCVEARGPQSHTFSWEAFAARYQEAFGQPLPQPQPATNHQLPTTNL